jgi:lipopolysaccharide export system protein LptA
VKTAPAFLAACLLCAPHAFAERADREKEIVVGADRLTADDANKVSTFEGSVVITQGTMRMTANKVTVREDAERHKLYVANGAPATFKQKRDKVDEWVEGSAERAEFDDRNDVLRLFNRARVRMNQNEITGDFISYDMKREVAEVSGAPPGTSPPPNSRVKVIILPPKKAPDAKTPETKATEKPAAEAPLLLKPDAGKS